MPAEKSLFEQRVLLCIKERGYEVVPQWEVNGKYIDLVVTGDHGRLAVECDGSRLNWLDPQAVDCGGDGGASGVVRV
ncbi:hypothetical protein ACIBL5_11415 [Streptomyces sp. NPDC050516]|uniref:hypothetical protein n=1 Tax=Streptomyces sp. NPDC050516 TaxID=3365621 RepID=UPI00378F208C